MENASKALIIAGAILISILLISVGILVMNSTGGVQDEMLKQMTSTQLQSFNASFTNYSGTNKTASDVKSLYGIVTSSNSTHDDSMQVTMTIGESPVTSEMIADLSTKVRYRIVVNVNTEKGVVDTIAVTATSASGTGTSGSSTPAPTI